MYFKRDMHSISTETHLQRIDQKHLLKLDPHQHLFYRIPRLGLLSALVQYLLYNMSLDNDDDHDVDD